MSDEKHFEKSGNKHNLNISSQPSNIPESLKTKKKCN